MTNQSLVYFFGVIIVILSYSLYKSEEENRRLFNIATDLNAKMSEQTSVIRTQQLYLEYLYSKQSLQSSSSPINHDRFRIN